MATSEAEAQRHARERLEYEEQLKRVIVQSLRDQRRRGLGSEWESDMGLDVDEDDEEPERARKKSDKMVEKASGRDQSCFSLNE